MDKIKLSLLLVAVVISSLATAIYIHNQDKCEKIDYSDPKMWDRCINEGLCPIKNAEGSFIKYPIGCENG